MRVRRLVNLILTIPSFAAAQGLRVAPADAPARVAVAPVTEPGTRLTVMGRVLAPDGRPIPGASIYVYQTDANGEYVPGQGGGGSERPRLFGYLRSDARGGYSFTTIKPGSYPRSNNPAHIHFEVSADGFRPRVYEIVFENDPFINERFRAQAREPFGGVVIVTTAEAANRTLSASHDILLDRR